MRHRLAIPLMIGVVLGVAALGLASDILPGDGTVVLRAKVGDASGGFSDSLYDDGLFSSGIARIGDVDGDGIDELAVGACFDQDGGLRRGALWILFLNADATVRAHQKISSTQGGFTATLDDEDLFGRTIAPLGDHDGDGVVDIAVGACRDDDGGTNRGAVYVLFLNADGTVKSHQKISETEGGLAGAGSGSLVDFDQFGESLASLGDFDGDGIVDLAVGSGLDDDGGLDRGAVRILRLDSDGTVKDARKISATAGGFTGVLDDFDSFGWGVAASGDRNGDGTVDLVIGSPGDDDGGPDRGAVWILYLAPDGSVLEHHKISHTVGGFAGDLADGDRFGGDVAVVGDLDRNGVLDIAAGAPNHDGSGAAWTLRLANDESVMAAVEIRDGLGGFEGPLDPGDSFGFTVAAPGDLDGDGSADLAVGAIGDDGVGGNNRGAVWLADLARACGASTVNDLAGPIADTLFVNGTTGGAGRCVSVGEGALLWFAMLAPPAGGNGRFLVQAHLGAPTLDDVTPQPAAIGATCFPVLLAAGANPIAMWNGVGKVDRVGASQGFDGAPIPDPAPAPTVFAQLDDGDPVHLPAGTRITLQGVMIDPGSSSVKLASATNAVVLAIE